MTQESPGPSGATADDRLWAALMYFTAPFGPLIALRLPERMARPFVRAHHHQALALGTLTLVVIAVLYCPTLGIVLALYGIDWYFAYRALQGELFSIPYLTEFLARRDWE